MGITSGFTSQNLSLAAPQQATDQMSSTKGAQVNAVEVNFTGYMEKNQEELKKTQDPDETEMHNPLKSKKEDENEENEEDRGW